MSNEHETMSDEEYSEWFKARFSNCIFCGATANVMEFFSEWMPVCNDCQVAKPIK